MQIWVPWGPTALLADMVPARTQDTQGSLTVQVCTAQFVMISPWVLRSPHSELLILLGGRVP